MAVSYLVTFDLKNGREGDYEKVYEWAHRMGGFRYFRFDDGAGTWGRLASTTVIVPLNAGDTAAARDEFRTLLTNAGIVPTHVSVTFGSNWAAWSEVLQDYQVPAYAKQFVPSRI
jgi:hypothetical protein